MERFEIRGKRSLFVDFLISLCALSGLALSTFWGLSLRADSFAASDFKTVYASTWCLVHQEDAFAAPCLDRVFASNNVVLAPTWFGRAPVYPPTTLLLLTPLTWLPMVPAIYSEIAIDVLLLALSLTALLRYAEVEFGLGFGWRALAIVLFAAGPLLSFALTMGNLSVPAAALAIFAFVSRKRMDVWLCGASLALAIVLKPHIAIWPLIALLLLPEGSSRKVAVRAMVLYAATTAIALCWMAATGTLTMQVDGYFAVLHAEMSGAGSMSVSSREILPVISQITSMHTVLAFLLGASRFTALVSGICVLASGIFLLQQTRNATTEAAALIATGAWCAFGMLASYHRAHDGIMLLLLLPWFLWLIQQGRRSGPAWIFAGLYGGMSVGPSLDTLNSWSREGAMGPVKSFFLLRQAGIADICLLLVLLVALVFQNKEDTKGRLP